MTRYFSVTTPQHAPMPRAASRMEGGTDFSAARAAGPLPDLGAAPVSAEAVEQIRYIAPADLGRLLQLCEEALERQEAERASFLDEACGGDANLRQAVEALLPIVDDFERALQADAGALGVDSIIRASTSGTVLERNVVEGQYVGADTPLFTVADLTTVWVELSLFPRDIAKVRAMILGTGAAGYMACAAAVREMAAEMP